MKNVAEWTSLWCCLSNFQKNHYCLSYQIVEFTYFTLKIYHKYLYGSALEEFTTLFCCCALWFSVMLQFGWSLSYLFLIQDSIYLQYFIKQESRRSTPQTVLVSLLRICLVGEGKSRFLFVSTGFRWPHSLQRFGYINRDCLLLLASSKPWPSEKLDLINDTFPTWTGTDEWFGWAGFGKAWML